MPVEHLWQWLREDVTCHACHKGECELIEQVRLFENHINSMPLVVADRAPSKHITNEFNSHNFPVANRVRLSAHILRV